MIIDWDPQLEDLKHLYSNDARLLNMWQWVTPFFQIRLAPSEDICDRVEMSAYLHNVAEIFEETMVIINYLKQTREK